MFSMPTVSSKVKRKAVIDDAPEVVPPNKLSRRSQSVLKSAPSDVSKSLSLEPLESNIIVQKSLNKQENDKVSFN
jgi:hypothetical protein